MLFMLFGDLVGMLNDFLNFDVVWEGICVGV